MGEQLPVKLLSWIKSGSLEISENGIKSIEFSANGSDRIVRLSGPIKGFTKTNNFSKNISTLKKLANSLAQGKVTLVLEYGDERLARIGYGEKPSLKRIITGKNVEIRKFGKMRKLFSELFF